MKKSISILTALALAAASFADGWQLSSPYKANSLFVWKLSVKMTLAGADRTVTMKQRLAVDSKTADSWKGELGWTETRVDDIEMKLDRSWPVALSSAGSILSIGDDVGYSRMLAPLLFIYPAKAVAVGDKWTTKFKPGEGTEGAKDVREMTYDFEVVGKEKVGNLDTLRIKAKLTEDGPMKSEGFYWIAKDGRILKFEADIRHWTMRMGGKSGEIDAKLKGELVPGE
jgi:hypothetical protein